jgi:dTDP-4-amino-4,6-dideoxygalactose transaminase
VKIPFFGLDRQYAYLREELLEATDSVLSTGKVLDGVWTTLFEAEMARRTNREYAIAVNSCSQALLFTYIAYTNRRRERQHIAVPAYSFVATANAAKLAYSKIKFIDVDEKGLMNLNHLKIKEDKIDIVSYVNLFGDILDYDKLKLIAGFFSDDIPIVEDAAQSFGACYKGIPSGKLGDVSCLSFDPTKNLPNYGSGGMILTDDDDLYQMLINLRDNGKSTHHQIVGTNSKMSEVDCAHMLIKLKHFDAWQARRKGIAEYYNNCLHPYVDCPYPNENVIHAWHKYVIKTPDQYDLRMRLQTNGVETKIHYFEPLPLMAAFDQMTDEQEFYEANYLSNTMISLPIYPEMTDEEVEWVVKSIQAYYD